MKRCAKCNRIKEDTGFSPDNGSRTGLASWCKACVAKRYHDRRIEDPDYRARRNVAIKRYQAENPDAKKKAALKKKYGLTPEQHKQMYLDQNGCCAICGEPVEYDRMYTDHDHNTGRVRGLLCPRCNLQIAIFDNYDLFEKAVAYLERQWAHGESN